MVRLDTNAADYAILAIYFVAVLGIGFAAKPVHQDQPRLLPVGALAAGLDHRPGVHLGQPRRARDPGHGANGAQFGVYTVHYYWIGAIPAMVFLGLVMMPFYYGSKVRSVPEYLRLRFNNPTHVFNALSFAVATVLIAGVNLFALALVLQISCSAGRSRRHRRRGGDRARLHHARRPYLGDLQRGAAVLHHPRGPHPATLVGLHDVGGWSGLKDQGWNRISKERSRRCTAWQGTARRRRQPARRHLDPDRVRPGLRALVRLLDDELRRGAARAVGQDASAPRGARR